MVFFQAVLLVGYAYTHTAQHLARAPQAARSPRSSCSCCRSWCCRSALGDMDAARGAQPRLLGAVAAARHGRPAVLRRLDQRPAAAEVVRRHRPSRGQGPVLPLRRQQPRQHARPARSIRSSSSRLFADRDPGLAVDLVGYGLFVLLVIGCVLAGVEAGRRRNAIVADSPPLRRPGPDARGQGRKRLRRPQAADAQTGLRRCRSYRSDGHRPCRAPRSTHLGPAPPLDRPGRGAVEPDARRHHLHDHRHRRHPVLLGHSAGPVPA